VVKTLEKMDQRSRVPTGPRTKDSLLTNRCYLSIDYLIV
jgi:hypothetical protein